MDHLNPQTGQCDPSLDRLARMLGMSEKNVRRATARLCEVGLFTKKSHGGKGGRASYTPVWTEFRFVVLDWQGRMKTGSQPLENADADRTEMSGFDDENDERQPDNSVPTTGQSGPVVPDRNVRQTNIPNQTKNQLPTSHPSVGASVRDPEGVSSERALQGLLNGKSGAPKATKSRSFEPAATPGCSRSEASRQAAQRRLSKAIGCEAKDWQAAQWLLEPDDMDAAIGAEIHRRGEGIALLRLRMLAARMRYEGDRHAH